jgi:hypothetical protein
MNNYWIPDKAQSIQQQDRETVEDERKVANVKYNTELGWADRYAEETA